MLIKEFKLSEEKAVIDLLNEQFKENGWEAENEERIKKRIFSCFKASEANQLSLLLAEDQEGIIIGYLLIQWLQELWTDNPEAFISSFYVRASSRRKGTGTQLLKSALAEAKKRKCARVFLENNRGNPIYENAFYQKRGWKERTDVSIFEFTQS